MPFTHQLLAVFIALIWGTNFVFIELGLNDLPPFLFATLRFIFAALPLIFILPRPNVPWRYLIAYGFFIGFGQFGLLFWVMGSHMSPGLASLVIQVQAVFTIVLALVLFKETIRLPQVLALIISFAGIVLIAMQGNSDATPIGLAVILIAALSWSAGNLVAKKSGKVNIIAFLAWSSIFAIPPLALMSYYYEGPSLIIQSLGSAHWQAWAIVLWQTIGNTLIGYGAWNLLLQRYAAALVVPWALLVPVFGMAASNIYLGESMPWWKWVAAALIIAGLVLNLRATQAPSTPVKASE
jgi:O-acetylserine/cysteine efflux transporter